MWHSKRRLTEVVFLIQNKRSLQRNTCHVKQCSGWLLENRNPDSSQVSMLMDKKEGIRNASRKVPISYWEKICWRVEYVAQKDCQVSVLEDIQNSSRQSSEQSDLLTLKLSCLEQRVELADLQTIFNKILSFCEILAVPRWGSYENVKSFLGLLPSQTWCLCVCLPSTGSSYTFVCCTVETFTEVLSSV